jgi:hypothetical protein
MSNKQGYPQSGSWFTGFAVAIGIVICGMLGNPSTTIAGGILLLIVVLVVGGIFMRNSFMSDKLNSEAPPSREEDFPDLNESFTYQSDRSPDRSTRGTPLSYPTTDETLPPPPVTHVAGHEIFQHARNAVEATARTFDLAEPMPIDLGLLVFKGNAKPNIHRNLNIPYEADNIQPYVQLHVPVSPMFTSVNARVKFEILDADSQLLFHHEETYALNNGLNLLTPPARFGVHNIQQGERAWQLRISLGDTVIARHSFEWGTMTTPEIAAGVGEDGEISDALRKLVVEQKIESLSLDELLASQESPTDEQKSSLS